MADLTQTLTQSLISSNGDGKKMGSAGTVTNGDRGKRKVENKCATMVNNKEEINGRRQERGRTVTRRA